MVIFEVVSSMAKNRKIRLTETQHKHMLMHHPEVKGQEEKIASTLQEPDLLLFDVEDQYNYYKKFELTPVTNRKMLSVVVKYLNSDGFVVTAYFTEKVMRRGRVVVYEKK